MRFTEKSQNKLKRVPDFPSEPKQSRFKRGSNQYKKRRRSSDYEVLTWKNTRIFLSLAVFTLITVPYLTENIQQAFNRVFNTKATTKIVSPLPVYAEEAPEPVITSDPIEAEKIKFLRVTRWLESNNGNNPNPDALHSICKQYNKVNTVGWTGMQGYRKWSAQETYPGEFSDNYCFQSAEQEASTVNQWYEKFRANYTQAQTYCGWVHGFENPMNDCERWVNAQSL